MNAHRVRIPPCIRVVLRVRNTNLIRFISAWNSTSLVYCIRIMPFITPTRKIIPFSLLLYFCWSSEIHNCNNVYNSFFFLFYFIYFLGDGVAKTWKNIYTIFYLHFTTSVGWRYLLQFGLFVIFACHWIIERGLFKVIAEVSSSSYLWGNCLRSRLYCFSLFFSSLVWNVFVEARNKCPSKSICVVTLNYSNSKAFFFCFNKLKKSIERYNICTSVISLKSQICINMYTMH